MTPGLRALCVAMGFFVATDALAQIGDCPSIGRSTHYKVVLGDVGVPSASADATALRERLIAKLRTTEETLRLEGEQRQLETAVCPGHKPRDRTEFDRRTVDDLNGLNVVLEIWGNVTPASTASARDSARINFAMISLMRFEPTQASVLEVSFPRPPGSGNALSELMLSDALELRGLTALTVALRLQRDGRYDAAKRSYCEAHTLLDRVARAPNATPDWSTLSTFSRDRAADVVRDARTDPDYKGALKLVSDTAAACVAPT